MPTTPPDSPYQQGGRLRSDWVVAFDRNRWPPSVGIGGRFASDSASFGKLPMVFGEHAVHLSYLFIGTKAFGNHLLYSRRCRQLQLGFSWVSPASHKVCRV